MTDPLGNEDTITALSTPPGRGGIAVVRISGHESVRIINKVFSSGKKISDESHARAVVGTIKDPDTREPIDDVVVTFFKKPDSYTSEDLVEVSCHGGLYVQGLLLDIFTRLGARVAEPGEFTKRAFLGGKIDLSQAEAVADLISARVSTAHRASVLQMRGSLRKKTVTLRSKLVDLAARLELELDFSEEEVDMMTPEETTEKIESVLVEVKSLLDGYKTGRLIRNGALVPIVGKPNAGKSSLLNALLDEDRAIVTPVPGTTRDTIEEEVELGGFLVRLVDTAGLRPADEDAERLGVERTLRQIESADLIVWLLDPTTPLDDYDELIKGHVSHKNHLIVTSKADLRLHPSFSPALLALSADIDLSSKSGTGLKELTRQIMDRLELHPPAESPLVTNARQSGALRRGAEALEKALDSARKGAGAEFIALDLRDAMDHIGEVTGDITTDEVLDSIFSRFCIGK